MLDFIKFSTGAASGGAGVATATGRTLVPITGWIESVAVKYRGSPPATTDFTLSDEGDPESESIVFRANNATDFRTYPRRALQDNGNNNVTFDGTNELYGRYVVNGRLEATIAQANNDDYCEVTVWFER